MSKEKQIYRQQAKIHRSQIDSNDAYEDADKLLGHFVEAISPSDDDIIALYWPKGDEFDTLALLDGLAVQNDFKCALPVIQDNSRILKFVRWYDEMPMQKGLYDILQPVGQDFVLPTIIGIPLLAFDRKGHRLGYGGGYYDATIESLKKENENIVTVGICYAQQAVLFNLPVEEHDQKLDWVITPQGANKYI